MPKNYKDPNSRKEEDITKPKNSLFNKTFCNSNQNLLLATKLLNFSDQKFFTQ